MPICKISIPELADLLRKYRSKVLINIAILIELEPLSKSFEFDNMGKSSSALTPFIVIVVIMTGVFLSVEKKRTHVPVYSLKWFCKII
ncbi:hypothetical protein BLOT_012220 [Blomia tropicalis]|nr:hypothetical protein BLOT_012220 [Blomia tropicalis]